MARLRRRIQIPPRIVLICLLLVYAGIGLGAIKVMMQSHVYPAVAVYAVLSAWGALEVIAHPLLWRAAPKSLAGDTMQGVVFERSTGQRWTAVATQARGLLRRRVAWPIFIMLLLTCCCCIPGNMLVG